MTTKLNHGIREPAYPLGRQFFGYQAIVDWANANGYPHRFKVDTTWDGRTARFLYVKNGPGSTRYHRWVPMRGTRYSPDHLPAGRLP